MRAVTITVLVEPYECARCGKEALPAVYVAESLRFDLGAPADIEKAARRLGATHRAQQWSAYPDGWARFGEDAARFYCCDECAPVYREALRSALAAVRVHRG